MNACSSYWVIFKLTKRILHVQFCTFASRSKLWPDFFLALKEHNTPIMSHFTPFSDPSLLFVFLLWLNYYDFLLGLGALSPTNSEHLTQHAAQEHEEELVLIIAH